MAFPRAARAGPPRARPGRSPRPSSDARDARQRERRPPTPLDPVRLNDLALHYVARFATTRRKLSDYLARKVRERGWDAGDAEQDGGDLDPVERARPAIEALVARLADLRYVDDQGYAIMRGAALERRGLGDRRIAMTLRHDGITEADAAEPTAHAAANALDTALAFARRRRFGPYAREAVADPKRRQAQIAAFVRAGHAPALAQRIIALPPGADPAELADGA